MFKCVLVDKLDDYFKKLNLRKSRGIYFYRICNYSEEIGDFILKYYEVSRRSGIIIEGRIPNPTEKNLEYYNEIMGLNFNMDINFITMGLKKWLPRLNDVQIKNVAASIYDTLELMRKEGKNDNMLKNAYIKFMCWSYYKFERILNRLGTDEIPKILYEGNVSNYELKMLTILARAGCDIVLLEYLGDDEYQKLDSSSKFSMKYETVDLKPFPDGYNLKKVRKDFEEQQNLSRIYGIMPTVFNCTNAWINGAVFENILKSPLDRGTDPSFYNNCFIKMSGVEDKTMYLNDLYQFYIQLRNNNRKIVVLNKEIPVPTPNEIAKIKRGNYNRIEQMLLDLSANISYTANIQLQRIMVKSFVDVIFEESKKGDINLHKLTNKAVYLLCFIKRYQPKIFSNWSMPDISCLFYMGGCKNENEALFMKFMSHLPVDVVVFAPDLNQKCILEDKFLYEVSYENSLPVTNFPTDNTDIQMGTAAYHAERELDTIMYQDSGMYRNQQYGKAVSVSLKTTYEEIGILWDQELKYRPNFSVVSDMVNVPVIFAKVSGVKDQNVNEYFNSIKKLVTQDTYVINKIPFLEHTDDNPIKPYVTEFYKNNRLLRQKIKEHKAYQYGILREEVQDYILDKLQLLIDEKIIKGTFENGTEYTIISTVLNLKKEIIRLLQKFDFTKKNPKIIWINAAESVYSLEDSIMSAFLNLAGFDVVFFTPTGYQNIEKHFNNKGFEEHQIGEYMYDLRIPDFSKNSTKNRPSWREKIFKRGS